MAKLKIGLVFDDSLDRMDGVQRYIATLGTWLIEQGHDVQFLVGETKNGPFPEQTHSLSRNIAVRGNGNALSIPLPANKKNIQKLLAKEKFDVLHVQVPYNPFLAGRVISATDPKTAIVGTFHITAENNLTVLGARLMGNMQQKTLKKFVSFVSVSEAAQNFAKDNYKIDSEIIPNMVKLPDLKLMKKDTKAAPKVVFLGRLVERKGCRELLQAFSLVKTKPLPSLVICGDGPQRFELEKLSNKLGLKNRVEFLGRVEEQEKYAQLASADVAVFPSMHGESFGIVLLEAMSVNKPVVLAGDNPGYRTVLKDQKEHMLVNPKSTSEFANKLDTLLKDSDLRKELLAWQQTHLPDFLVEKVGPKIVNWYEDSITK